MSTNWTEWQKHDSEYSYMPTGTATTLDTTRKSRKKKHPIGFVPSKEPKT